MNREQYLTCNYCQNVTSDEIKAILVDFSKAFDKVPHHLLLLKLKHYSIQGNILNWISDFFLSECTQHVACGGSTSKPINVTSSVPQASLLLLLTYINDISVNLSSSRILFADDCILFRNILSAADAKILQEDLNKLVQWAGMYSILTLINVWYYKLHLRKILLPLNIFWIIKSLTLLQKQSI